MGQFRHFINEAVVKEVHMEGRLFTWSNERSHPTLEKIDRVFISMEWENLFPRHELLSLPSLYSDHAPLLLKMDSAFVAKKRFIFRSFWPSFLGF
jgi:endonuclease/exonuclease/phosphatase family metal-dependent hydrolase